MFENLPEKTRRLFGHYRHLDRLAEESPGLVVGRLLEEGDATDLRWLTESFEEAEIAEWLDRSGHRQLSRRSLSFWAVVLDRPATLPRSPGDPLWPL